MKVLGLTGGIGAGKTTVTHILDRLGATIIRADTVGHEVYRPGTDGWQQVTAAFGEHIVAPDGTIDRKKLGTIVFEDPEELQRLNAIVHPLIHTEIVRRLDAAQATAALPVVLEAAILVESPWVTFVDEVWVVVATRQMIVDRLCADRGMTPEEVAARMRAQIEDAQRREAADVLIENNGSLDDLTARVAAAWAQTISTL